MVKTSHKKKKPTAPTVGSKRISTIPYKHNCSIADITWKSQALKVIKYILTASGFVTFLFACCITTTGDDKWYVPMLIGLGGMGLVGIAVLIDYRQRFRADKPVVKIQNCDYASEFEKLYNKIILVEIMKGEST